jgi:UDP-glucuronate 4-epimerase
MSILITGGAGFIGSHFIERMHARTGEMLVALDNFNDYYDPRLKRANAEQLKRLERVEMVEGDFCDAALVERLLAEHAVDRVVHLGAYAGVRYSVENPTIYQQVNVGGTLTLLEAVRKRPVDRFLLISSSTVYGCGAEIPFREDAPLGIPASPYGATKRAAELMGLTYHQLHRVPVVCLRPFSVYGPRLRPDLALTIFADAIVRQVAFPLFGDGTIRRDYTHVNDICEGLGEALERDGVVGETINLGHSEPVEMRRVIELMERALGRSAIIDRRPQRPEDLPVTFADLTKAERLLDYHPQVPLDEGLSEFCDWFVSWHERSPRGLSATPRGGHEPKSDRR